MVFDTSQSIFPRKSVTMVNLLGMIANFFISLCVSDCQSLLGFMQALYMSGFISAKAAS